MANCGTVHRERNLPGRGSGQDGISTPKERRPNAPVMPRNMEQVWPIMPG